MFNKISENEKVKGAISFLKSIKQVLISIAFVGFIFLVIGIFDYIKIKRADNYFRETIEKLESTIIEVELELHDMKEIVKNEKLTTEREKQKRKVAEAKRLEDLKGYTKYLTILAKASAKERNDILEEFSNFKYEN